MSKEDNGEASWILLRDRAQAQGRRIDTLEVAIRTHAEASLKETERMNERIGYIERDVSSIKTTLKLVAGGVMFASPFLTAILIKALG